MRSYGQYCPLAKTLDVVGDRWSLLIVRELLTLGDCRYTDLRKGLPGIATNLLADRLRDLEDVGVVSRVAAAPPVATTLFRLTPRGEELRPVLRAMAEWGVPLLAGAGDDDVFQAHWLGAPAAIYLVDTRPDEPAVTLEVCTGEGSVTLEAAGGAVRALRGPLGGAAGARLSGPHRPLLGVIAGRLTLAEAQEHGVTYDGDPAVLARMQPKALVGTAR